MFACHAGSRGLNPQPPIRNKNKQVRKKKVEVSELYFLFQVLK